MVTARRIRRIGIALVVSLVVAECARSSSSTSTQPRRAHAIAGLGWTATQTCPARGAAGDTVRYQATVTSKLDHTARFDFVALLKSPDGTNVGSVGKKLLLQAGGSATVDAATTLYGSGSGDGPWSLHCVPGVGTALGVATCYAANDGRRGVYAARLTNTEEFTRDLMLNVRFNNRDGRQVGTGLALGGRFPAGATRTLRVEPRLATPADPVTCEASLSELVS